jgi:hypothetical protein
MRISCVTNPTEVGTDPSDLIVFPEYSDANEINTVASRIPNSIIVAAVLEGRRSRGVLFHQGKNRIDYLKIGTDGHSIGTKTLPRRMPIYELPNICVGVVICMDIQEGPLWPHVIERLKASTSPRDFLCVPADMGSEWFSGNPKVDFRLEGIHLIVCNHPTGHDPRCKSFMTCADLTVVRQQFDREPLHLDLP